MRSLRFSTNLQKTLAAVGKRVCACISARARERASARLPRGIYLLVTRERRVENRRTGIALVYRVTPISDGGCAARRRHFLLLTHSLTCYSFAGNYTPPPYPAGIGNDFTLCEYTSSPAYRIVREWKIRIESLRTGLIAGRVRVQIER